MYFDKNPKNVYGNQIFQDVYHQDIKININSKNFVEMNEGEIIYQVGDNGDSLYLLLTGQIKIKFYGNIGGSSPLKKIDNDFFGEYELLEKSPRRSAAMAVVKSLLYVISGKDLNELTKNKTILVNLFNQASIIGEVSHKAFDDLEASNEFNIVEDNNIETTQDANSSSITSSPKPLDFEEGNDNLSWNTSNIDEFKDIFYDEELLDDKDVNDSSLHDEAEFDYDKANLSNTIDETENSLHSIQPDEVEPLIDTKETINTINNDYSIIDSIKEELRESYVESTDKPAQGLEANLTASEESQLNEDKQIVTENIPNEITSDETKSITQEDETQELTKKITETIYNEINTPIESIKNFTELLMQKSSSTEANKVLQKIIDQLNLIRSSLKTQASLFNEKLEIKTQIFHASNVLNDILLLLAGYTEFRKIKLFRKFEADASILVDKNLLYQACLQIIRFLCENITDEGSIFVTVNRTKDIISIEFTSSGDKITDVQLQKIFEPFTFKDNPGLGLAKRIISKHNGNITAKNSDDVGLEIKVFLPIVV